MKINLGSLGFAVIDPHIWRASVMRDTILHYIWAVTTEIPKEPKSTPYSAQHRPKALKGHGKIPLDGSLGAW